LTRIVAPGGRVVLSGLLSAQANAALAAYDGFRLERRIVLDGWATLVLTRSMRSHRRGGFKTRPTKAPRAR
jgi:ribosomal protein L11 methyltransferase